MLQHNWERKSFQKHDQRITMFNLKSNLHTCWNISFLLMFTGDWTLVFFLQLFYGMEIWQKVISLYLLKILLLSGGWNFFCPSVLFYCTHWWILIEVTHHWCNLWKVQHNWQLNEGILENITTFVLMGVTQKMGLLNIPFYVLWLHHIKTR